MASVSCCRECSASDEWGLAQRGPWDRVEQIDGNGHVAHTDALEGRADGSSALVGQHLVARPAVVGAQARPFPKKSGDRGDVHGYAATVISAFMPAP